MRQIVNVEIVNSSQRLGLDVIFQDGARIPLIDGKTGTIANLYSEMIPGLQGAGRNNDLLSRIRLRMLGGGFEPMENEELIVTTIIL